MFWGLILKANRKYTQKIKKGFHVSQAALDVSSCSEEPVQVMLTSENHNYILCTLRKNKVEQVALDLNFAEGDEISFTSQGNGNVHLSGYLIPEPEEDLDLLGEEESEDEEVQNEVAKKEKQTKVNKPSTSSKKAAKEEDDEDEDDSIFDSDEEGEEDDDDDIEDEEDEEDDEEGEGESSSEEEVVEPKPKQIKLDNKQNGLENGKIQPKEKQKKKKEKKQQKQQQEDKSPKGGEKTLQGGVRVEDIRVGNGPEAKPGKKVQVYYEGRLKSNNKLFDSSKPPGAGFKFALCRGEVIKGWDVGVVGMKVGGKRRITCPPNMAYGAKGSPPVIPPNSTLVFEVELKGVN